MPKPFIVTENYYGNLTGGNIQINLPKHKNPMLINSFPVNSIIERANDHIIGII